MKVTPRERFHSVDSYIRMNGNGLIVLNETGVNLLKLMMDVNWAPLMEEFGEEKFHKLRRLADLGNNLSCRPHKEELFQLFKKLFEEYV